MILLTFDKARASGPWSALAKRCNDLNSEVFHEVRKIGAFGFLNKPASHDWIEPEQVIDDFPHLVRLMNAMISHAKRIPGVRVHRLKLRCLL